MSGGQNGEVSVVDPSSTVDKTRWKDNVPSKTTSSGKGEGTPVRQTGSSFSRPKRLYVDVDNYDGPSRVWTPWPKDRPFPCFPGEQRLMLETPAQEGILFQRPEKTGSTTIAGMVMRLAHNRAVGRDFEKCKHRAYHGKASKYQYGMRDKSKSFLFSIIRDPTTRAISRFFHFEATVYQHDPTDATFQTILQRIDNFNALSYDLSTANSTLIIPGMDHTKLIENILDNYNLIMVMERLDESLVVLRMLLHLDLYDILFIKARGSGSFSNGFPDRPCVYILPSFVTPGMEAYFESDKWKDRIRADNMLFQAAYKSLDRTIDALGRDKVEQEVALLRETRLKAEEFCKGKVRTMCSDGGEVIKPRNTTCYIWGEGCDNECLNDFKEMQTNQGGHNDKD